MPIEIVEHSPDRAVEIIKVEPIEAGALLERAGGVVLAQPTHERVHVGISPHPGGEAPERRFGISARGLVPDMPIDSGRIRPIRLDRDHGEAVLLDQPAGDGGARAIELAGAVARFAEKDDARGAEPVKEPPECRIVERRQRLGRFANEGGNIGALLRLRLLALAAIAFVVGPFIVRPAMGADEGDKHHSPEILLLKFGLACAHELDQRLMPLRRAHRHDEATAGRKLMPQRIGDAGAAGGDENGVERLRVGPALGTVPDTDLDIVIAEPLEALARDLGELRVALDGIDLIGDHAEDGRRIAGAGADLEHAAAGPDLGGLDHQSDDIGLGNRLPRLNGKGGVLIGELGEIRGQELLARHPAHGI